MIRSSHIAVLVLAAAICFTAGGTAASTRTLSVFFVRGEQVVGVHRSGTSAADAVGRLLAGPTRAEVKQGFRTYVPVGTKVNRVQVVDNLATVDLSARFVAGRNRDSLQARLAQLVRTVTGVGGVTKVQLLVDGQKVTGVFPGIPTAGPLTFAFLQTPNVPAPRERKPKLGPPDPAVKRAQVRLIQLGYLAGKADGRFGPVTQEAVLALQKWERLNRTGTVDAPTTSRLATAVRPVPVRAGSRSKRAEVLLDRQVALLILDNKVVRTIAVSTGKPSTPTPPGSYRVYAKIERWWSVPFREWLPWAVPFVGGIAFHEFPVVPAYPASHGCVRQAVAVAHGTYDFAEVGMPVRVFARS
jgi:lipoprotein-anchoring transpeptidase ErfK/SrfK